MLTPPSVTDLGKFRGENFASSEFPGVQMLLTQASDAVWVYTRMSEYPEDGPAYRVVRNAIMALTLWLMSQQEHSNEINSPFTSERIGSYSYSKLQQAKTGASGIYWLDLLFELLGDAMSDALGGSLVTSEAVFPTPYAGFDGVYEGLS